MLYFSSSNIKQKPISGKISKDLDKNMVRQDHLERSSKWIRKLVRLQFFLHLSFALLTVTCSQSKINVLTSKMSRRKKNRRKNMPCHATDKKRERKVRSHVQISRKTLFYSARKYVVSSSRSLKQTQQ